MVVPATASLLGRSSELEAVMSGMGRAAQGGGQVFSIVGEPGIGKTRLATEVATRAETVGLQTYWGRALESGGAPAYWPWRQLLEAMRPEWASSAGSGPLQRLWSQQGSGDFSTSDPSQARFELFSAVVQSLREFARQKPALCVLDDLHAADAASLELTSFAIGALTTSPIVWVLTWRDAEGEHAPVRDVLARLTRRGTVLKLRRLSHSDSTELIRTLLPSAGAELQQSVFDATGGNPLFLHETLRALADGQGAAIPVGAQLPVAQGIALVVRERVARLEPEARALVEIGAVMGREVSAEIAAASADLTNIEVKDLARDVVATGLWRELDMHRWQFSHALVRDALYRELGNDRRRALHAQVALALDSKVATGTSELSLTRAHHGFDAFPKLDANRIAGWALDAAQQARAQRAYEEGAMLLQRALRELQPDGVLRGELLMALGWVFGDLGDVTSLHRAFDDAIACARKLAAPELFARAVLGRASVYVHGDVRNELLPLLDEALGKLSPDARNLTARLLARKAAAMTPAPEPTEPLKLARSAWAMTADIADPRARLDIAVGVGSALGEFASPTERILVNTELVISARTLGDRVMELRGLSRLVTDHLESGDVSSADAVLLERDALASSLGHSRFRWHAPLFRSMRAMMEGRFDVCDSAFAEVQTLVDGLGDPNAQRCLALHRTWQLVTQDRLDALKEYEPTVVRNLHPMLGLPTLMQAYVQARTGRISMARETLHRAAWPDFHNLFGNNFLTAAGEVAVLCNHREVAERAFKFLQPHADSNATMGLFGLACWVPVQSVLASLAGFLGHPTEEVAARFEVALERTDAMGAKAHEAWVRLWYGQTLKNREQLESCIALARAHQMEGVALRAEKSLESMPSAAVRPAAPSPQTPDFKLERHEGGWRLQHGTTSVVLKDLRGMSLLVQLLERPGEEVHSVELVSQGSGSETEVVDAGDAGDMLDEKARHAYRRRIENLTEQIEDAEERGNFAAAERARTELEALSKELSRAVGLGGRVRRAGSSAERARITAQRRLREAIQRIVELDSEIGNHLSRTVRTGTFCAYEPNRKVRR